MSADDDLDAMLDGALDELGEQEDQQREEVRRRDELAAQMAEEQQAAGAGGDGAPEELQKVFMTLAGMLHNPEALESGDGLARMQAMLRSTVSNLQEDPNATEEERAELARCARLVEQLDKPEGTGDEQITEEDAAKAQASIAELMKTMQGMKAFEEANGAAGQGAEGAQGGSAPADDAAIDQLLQMMEAAARQGESGAAGGANAAAGEPSPEELARRLQELAASGPSSGAEAPENPDAAALQMVTAIWSDPSFSTPFRNLAEKFPAYLDANRASLSADDLARYEKQCAAAKRVVALLGDLPLHDGSLSPEKQAERFGEFSACLEELSALGAPPPELVQQPPQAAEAR